MANLAPYIRSEERPFKMAKRAANGRWHSILVSCGIEAHFLTNVHKPCPGCDGKDRFRFDDLDGDGTFYCSNYEKQSGDGFALLQHVHSIDSKEALKMVLPLIGSATLLPISQVHIRDNARFPNKKSYTTLEPDLLEYWKTLAPLGDIAAEYLRSRRCFVPPADSDVRCTSNVVGLGFDWQQGPAFVSLISDAVTGEPISLHITWVKADGTKPYDRRVIANHTTSNGVIRLCPLLDDERTLAVAEGVETALTLAHRFMPVWATLNSGNLTNFPLIENVDHLIIAVDRDRNQVGQKAAHECATRYAKAGRRVSLVMSPREGEDLNDFIRGCK